MEIDGHETPGEVKNGFQALVLNGLELIYVVFSTTCPYRACAKQNTLYNCSEDNHFVRRIQL